MIKHRDARSLIFDKVKRPIVFTGMMASGKGTIGSCLAKMISRPFLDVDSEIENVHGTSIAEIFNTHGEQYFRSIEHKIVERYCKTGSISVIALGGGAFVSQVNNSIIRSNCLTVFINPIPEILIKRLVRDHSRRPILHGLSHEGIAQKVGELLDARMQFYKKADIMVDFDVELSVPDAVAKTLANIYEYLKKNSIDN